MDLRHQQFFSAIKSGDLQSLKLLTEREVFSSLIGMKNEVGDTALHIAVENNHEDVVRYLLKLCDYETSVITSKVGITAFYLAAKKGHTGVVREFLATWPQACKVCDSTNTSPLYTAGGSRRKKKKKKKKSPLYTAAVLGHMDVVNAILDVDKSTIRIVRKNGKTALHTTARTGNYQIAKALIERDPGVVSIIDKKGQTALHMAVKGREATIVDIVEEMLLVDPSILNAVDKKGNTPLHVATRKLRAEIVRLLLSYQSIQLNAINNQKETAMDLAEKNPYNDFSLDIVESLREAGAKHARNVGKADEASELRRTVSDIRHDVHTQLKQNAKTNKRVSGIAKDLRKLHREAVQNTINSVTVVAVLIASIAFIAIFNLPGQYIQDGDDVGKANIAGNLGFRLFCLLNGTALFISLAVVVVQITLVAWETGAQKLVVSVVNKLMWTACASTLAAFLSLAFVVVGNDASWMAITITAIGVPMMVGTLGIMCYLVFRQYFSFNDDSQRRIKRGGGSRSFSMSLPSAQLSDPDAIYSDHEKKIYAL